MMSSPMNICREITTAHLTLLEEKCSSSSSSEDEAEKSEDSDEFPMAAYGNVKSPEIGFTPKTGMNDSCPSVEGLETNSQSTEPLKTRRSHKNASTDRGLLVDSESRRRLCVVCEDYASGYHYGIASCEACKAFFKRTVQGQIQYTCPSNNNCEITKKRRKTCQKCRYQKCIRMGMLIEGVRPNRLRGGRQKYRRKPEETDFGPSPSKRPKPKKLNELTQLLLRIDAPMVKLEIDPTLEDKDPTYRAVKMVADIADKDLKFTVNWAKQIPGFQQLPMTDQMSLLQGSWMEILLIGLLYRSLHLTNPDRVLFTDNLIMTKADSKLNGFDSLADRSLYLVKRMRELDIQREEYVLLKAIALINADVTDVDCPSGIEQLELRIYDALHEFTQTHYPATCARREMKLITLLPGFRQLSNDSINHFNRNFIERNVPMRQLFREMIEAKHDC
ncbi:steroid hormone receptor ERR1-like [Anneissia japonica]|uniref:steroid hormone receptor ERR1-like n=1 Tax=Anneissia japonica TaxID=1529436 RepID=UPI0014258FEA|nr:steroid hormone receptor ERR1-like [Anneissia japonica]XP_033096326.1 steroid hormone receptor ERR1-like [Anneissia japonica]XP_033096327.1 steroid hormone receptor ERR1-like [Anneissia japonica]XP_033096328.1 steroid hormone receptor ERR1-like [Anneissia japonica]XP_033096329.1 steroid hormone receptor ERR1-like [Anneissia japonica]